MENKNPRGQPADSEDEACENSISRRIKRIPLPTKGQESETTAENLAHTDIEPTCPRAPQSPLQTHDDIVKGDLPEESKRQALLITQQQRGPERTAADPDVDKALTVGASETFRSPRGDNDQGSWLRLDYDELSQLSSNHPDYKDGGSSLSSLDLDLEFHRGGGQSYGAYISGMKSLAKREADQSDMEGLSELMVSLDSNKVVPHDRDDRKSSARRETIHPIDNRPAPERAGRMPMLSLLRKPKRGARGEGRPGSVSRVSGTGASAADVRVSESSSNRRRAGEPTRRFSVRHLGSILGGLLRKKSSGGQSSESRHSLSAGELAGLDSRSLSETSHTGGKPTTSADKTSAGVPQEIRRGVQHTAAVAGFPREPEAKQKEDAEV